MPRTIFRGLIHGVNLGYKREMVKQLTLLDSISQFFETESIKSKSRFSLGLGRPKFADNLAANFNFQSQTRSPLNTVESNRNMPNVSFMYFVSSFICSVL